MKITAAELFTVEPRWLILKLSTDEGICGWSEPIVEGRASTVDTVVRALEPYLLAGIRTTLRISGRSCIAAASSAEARC